LPIYDLVVVGHFALDVIVRRGRPVQGALGGPPTYASLAARKMGALVGVISKIGDDFPAEYMRFLNMSGIDLSGLKVVEGARTTSYVLEYLNGDRKLVLKARAPPITPGDVPADLMTKAVLVSPIAGEVSSALVAELRRHSEFLCLDPQGLVRSFGPEGSVEFRGWFDVSVLSITDIFKASLREYELVVGTRRIREGVSKLHRLGVGVIIITLGEEGSLLSTGGGLYAVPAYETRIVETTGAGDAYIGAFLAEYIRGEDPVWCACVGSAAASFVVEAFGPARFGSREEVLARAEELYNRVAKV